jgi:hypothetical protein
MGGGSTVTVDSELSLSSENPVQNKVITGELNKKTENFLVNFSFNFSTFTYACDKTYNEIASAFASNKNVIGIVTDADGAKDYYNCYFSELEEIITFVMIYEKFIDGEPGNIVINIFSIDSSNNIGNNQHNILV